MPQYAAFNSALADPKPVTGWYDTDEFTYPNLPAASDLLLLTSAQWAAHFANLSGFAVAGTPEALVSYTPPSPAPTIAQQAQAVLTAGLTVKSTSGDWTTTFSVLQDASGNSIPTLILGELAALSASGGAEFADGATTVQWPDMSTPPVLRSMSPTQFQAFAKAGMALVAACRNFANGVTGAALPGVLLTSVVIP
jgi:hypothetical protein